MPTYDYHCPSCGKRFEAWQKMSDEPITVCPDCSGQVRRIIHPAGIVFKGGGFYKTDHRVASPATPPSGDTAAEPATSGATTSPSAPTAGAASGETASGATSESAAPPPTATKAAS
ncbi:MAG: hypothetical protein IVW57_15765 [Ktedonobacterales bacterium]|nr:hypothetical protein [Ktedonobacterales bacterium]